MSRALAAFAVFGVSIGATPSFIAVGDATVPSRPPRIVVARPLIGVSRPSGPRIVTRPAFPLQRSFDGFHRHRHHRRGPVLFFVEPSFFALPFGYPYAPYRPYSSLYEFGAPRAYARSPSTISEPYYCWIDGIGFSDEDRFAHHLREVHGVPLERALSASEQIGGRYVFFGY